MRARARRAAIVRENRDVVAGVKVRLGTGACGDNVDAALDAALEAADAGRRRRSWPTSPRAPTSAPCCPACGPATS